MVYCQVVENFTNNVGLRETKNRKRDEVEVFIKQARRLGSSGCEVVKYRVELGILADTLSFE